MEELFIPPISKSRKTKAKSRIKPAFKNELRKNSCFWKSTLQKQPLWLGFWLLRSKAKAKSPTKHTLIVLVQNGRNCDSVRVIWGCDEPLSACQFACMITCCIAWTIDAATILLSAYIFFFFLDRKWAELASFRSQARLNFYGAYHFHLFCCRHAANVCCDDVTKLVKEPMFVQVLVSEVSYVKTRSWVFIFSLFDSIR